MAVRSILVVDDDPDIRKLLERQLAVLGHRASVAASPAEALEAAASFEFDAILSDLRLPGKDGIELIGEIRSLRPDTPVILMTAYGTIDSAVAAMRAGAFDYLVKPFRSEVLSVALERALGWQALQAENRELRRALDRTRSLGDFVGESPAMRELFALIPKVAATRAGVLITGESGTGKDLVARSIHYVGPAASRPFVPINCTAIPEGLLESELFGHVRGAFTGAVATKEGLFQKANGGTLFLDEIGDMSLPLQAKLLRVLQDGQARPVGSTESVKVDVRVIAATNQDLPRRIEMGAFRRDLFYRLNVIPIRIPPLRERPEDIPPLIEHFVRRSSNGQRRRFTQSAIERLQQYSWAGNARELENVVERALALCSSPEIGSEDLPFLELDDRPHERDRLSFLEHAAREGTTLEALEARYLRTVLEHTRGNKGRAAAILGLSRRSLYRRLAAARPAS